MNTQSTASRLPLPPVAGPRNAIAQREPPPIRPSATKPARNYAKLTTQFSRSSAKHGTCASLVPPIKLSPKTPTTLVCLRCASAFLKPKKPARNHALLTHRNLTISRKTLEIRPDPALRKKVSPGRAIRWSRRRNLAIDRPNRIERNRTAPNDASASAREFSRTQPNRPERTRTHRTSEHPGFIIENTETRQVIPSAGS